MPTAVEEEKREEGVLVNPEEMKNTFSKVLEEKLGDELSNRIDSHLDKLGLTKETMASKLPVMDTSKKLNADQKKISYFKALLSGDKKTLWELSGKGLTEGTDSEGGFLVPEELQAEVDRIIENVGLIRTLSRKLTMTRDTLNMPQLDSAASVTFPGEATAGRPPTTL